MKTILYGPVTAAHLADAALFSGIEPSAYITNGETVPPCSSLMVDVIPPDHMVGDAAPKQNHWRMVLQGDALICVGDNPHLVHAAETHSLLVYEAAV